MREARVEDARAIAEVHVRAWQAAYRGLMPQDFLDRMTDQIPDREKRWREMLEGSREAAQTFVVERDGRVVGIAMAGPTGDDDHEGGEVLMINLVEEAWGTGAGAALFERLLEHLRASGFHDATLWVLDSNARARRFYEKYGWAPDGATKTDDGLGFAMHEVRYGGALTSVSREPNRRR